MSIKRRIRKGKESNVPRSSQEFIWKGAKLLFAVYADEQTRPDLLPRDIVETTIITRNYTRDIYMANSCFVNVLSRGAKATRGKSKIARPRWQKSRAVQRNSLQGQRGEFRSCLSRKIERVDEESRREKGKLINYSATDTFEPTCRSPRNLAQTRRPTKEGVIISSHFTLGDVQQ